MMVANVLCFGAKNASTHTIGSTFCVPPVGCTAD